ncbi:uncharacterized protein VTP21DRAFT_8782 [Calcarisporiella thermophila]|uniref:uncharacterized protein n=1 Tax=Calcarisporiella thermophila TaxID=911321 RepID=UPI003742A9AC
MADHHYDPNTGYDPNAAAYYADPSSYDPNSAAYYQQYYANYNYYDPSYYAQGGESSSGATYDINAPIVDPFTAAPKTTSSTGTDKKGKKDGAEKKKKKVMRVAGGEIWEDPTMEEWDENDFRLFCGDLGKEVTDEMLAQAFSKYPSFLKAKVIRDKAANKSKGYGFVSFRDGDDFVRAFREMNGKYVGNRPIKLRKSTWKERTLTTKKKKEVQRLAPYAKR